MLFRSQKITIAYWKIRGLAQPIRYLLEYCGFPYEDVRYDGNNREGWNSIKDTLGLDFPNLPYLMDGDLKITQSNAILRYIALKKGDNLVGKDLHDQGLVSMLLEVAMDFRNTIVRICYNPEFENLFVGWKSNEQKKYHSLFSKYLGNKKFMVGDYLTFPDFHIFELLDQSHIMNAEGFNDYPNLVEYMNRFKEVPAIKKYRSSEQFIERPINNPSARFR